MPFITEAQEQALAIQRMIFHVVGAGPDRPILLDRIVDVRGYEQFFIARVKDTLRGAQYQFQEIAGTRQALHRALESEAAFIEQSRHLANRFQVMYEADRRLSAGVLLILQLCAGEETLFDIIKFDHDPAVTYQFSEDGGERRAVLEEISDHFSRHREAMQKSALIRVREDGGEVIAIDRSSKIDITGPFQTFLDVRRTFEHAELTARMFDILYRVGMKHQDDLDAEVVRGLKHRVKSALIQLGEFDPAEPEGLKNAIFGPLAEDHPIHRSFDRALAQSNMADETIEFDDAALPRTKRLVKETREGIQVFIPPDEEGRVDQQDAGGGETYLRIRTAGLRYDDVEIERTRRRG